MPPIRFLHAASIDLDAALLTPPAGAADVFAEAPLAALDRLVAGAVEQQVDFLLVSAASSCGSFPSFSLAAESELRDRFATLSDAGIPVYLADPERSGRWKVLEAPDSGVVRLSPGAFAAITDSKGRPAGVLRCIDRPEGLVQRAAAPRESDALELTVAPLVGAEQIDSPESMACDYLGLGAGGRATVSLSRGVAHAPGPVQASGPWERGACGATLVSIDEGGAIQTAFVSTGVVRFERIVLEAPSDEPLDDLAVRMAEHLESLGPEPGERVWSIEWAIASAGALLDQLENPARRADLIGLLPATLGTAAAFHRIAATAHPIWPALADPFAAEFAAGLAECERQLAAPGSRLNLLSLAAGAPRRDRLARRLASLDADAVLAVARRLGCRVAEAAAEELD